MIYSSYLLFAMIVSYLRQSTSLKSQKHLEPTKLRTMAVEYFNQLLGFGGLFQLFLSLEVLNWFFVPKQEKMPETWVGNPAWRSQQHIF